MFEGKLPKPGAFQPLEDEHIDAECLRSLSWADLVARLSAARELRAALRPGNGGSDASFDAGSARRIAAHSNGKQPVNLDTSSNGKVGERTANRVDPALVPGVPAAPRGIK